MKIEICFDLTFNSCEETFLILFLLYSFVPSCDDEPISFKLRKKVEEYKELKMSDSEGMDLEIDVSEGVPDDSICPVCKRSTYIGETISCETCMYW